MEYESNGDGSKILSIGGYLNRIRRYLKDIINNLKKKKRYMKNKTDNIN